MKRLTDFQIAALSAVPSLIGGVGASAVDIWWAIQDQIVTDHWYLPVVIKGLSITLICFVISAILLVWSLKRHKETGEKPVQSKDDIDYRIMLALRKERLARLKMCEVGLQHKTKRRVRNEAKKERANGLA